MRKHKPYRCGRWWINQPVLWKVYAFCWKYWQRVRVFFKKSARPKRCCRDESLRGNWDRTSGISFRRCTHCQCRHFEMTADSGRLGIRLAG